MAQYTLTGFDASAHMTEETVCHDICSLRLSHHSFPQRNAATAGSHGIILSIGVSALLGWFLLLGLLFSIQDFDGVLGAKTGQPVAQIFIDAVGNNGAIALMVIIIVAMYFCG